MREIFFNSFKEKILRGDVESHITASGIPMSDAFLDTYDTDDISIEQYRNLEDFDRFSNGNKTTKFEETKFKYETYGVDYQNYYEDDLSEKPIFVNADNAEKFLQVYGNEILYSDPYVKSKIDSYLASDDININSGFYYVTKKSHLNWIAKRVNDDYNFNNRIVVVLGDDIGTSNEEDGIAYESVIGANPNKPFQGIFDLNGHAVNNLNLKCKTNSNGIIGYLGDRGIVRDGIVINPVFTGMNKISLDKIKNDCSDVVCGTLVGTNYGTVENIVTSGTMRIMDGFCPEVYLAGNKTEYQAGMNTYEENNYTNAFFPSKFCINSIYNVIPYVGYFCEGADSYFNDAVDPFVKEEAGDTLERWKYLTRINVDMRLGMDNKESDANKIYNNVSAYNLDHYLEGKLSNTSHCDLSDVALAKVIPYAENPTSGNSTVGGYEYDMMSNKADTIWFGYWNKNTTGNTYLADIYRAHRSNSGIFQFLCYIRPLITMSTDQIIPDKLMKNTVKSIGKFVDLYGDEQFDLTQNPSFMHQYPDYAANLAHQIRDQIVMYYENLDTYASHLTTHQKMNPYSRIAYYLSPIVGNNFGTIRNIDCRHTIRESDYTFVGFIGNVCGKENCGDISNCYVDLDIESSRTDDKLAVRNYTDTNNYLPNYEELNSAYSNQINIFGYNYDYCQSPYGTPEDEYSANSASCVKITPRFYSYRDLYQGEPFLPYGVRNSKFSDFVFNVEGETWLHSGNIIRDEFCNFNVRGNETEAIARNIPDKIRKQKLKFRFEKIDPEQADLTGPDDYSIVVRLSSLYTMIKKASYKFYNPYYKDEKDNWEEPFWENQIDSLYSAFDAGSHHVQHMDLNYLGDAAKTVSRNDVWKGAPTKQNAAGENYKVTIADILDYCPDFNGSQGRTEDKAKEFCRNMMDAKVAIGWDMIGNQTFSVSYKYPDYDHPFDNDNGFFGTTNNGDKHFIIPANTGPNDTDTDWDLGTNLVDMAWYMPPAPNEYPDDNGPKAFDPSVSVLADNTYVNSNANNPSNFCSIQPYGLWDLYGDPKEKSYKLFNEDGISKPSIGRSMLTIEPRYGMVNLASNVAKIILDGDPAARGIINRNRLPNTELECCVSKIFIPMANRTQKSAWQSSTFCEETGCSGIYITDYGRKPLYDNNLNPSSTIVDDDIGNLDVAYVDMSIGVRVEEMDSSDGRYRYETYPVIVQIPIEKIFIPISAVRAWPVQTATVNGYMNDRMTELVNESKEIKRRYVRFYHLTPAYDLLDPNNAQVQYKLKSIYNIGGIAGMINHSEKYIEQGFYNFDGKLPVDHEKSNKAKCGSISDCNVYITNRTNQFVSDLQCSWTENPDNTGGLVECNNRTIGVANKIGGVAAIYEYRQNDIGTSPHSKKKEACTDGLQRFRFQKFRFSRINVGGTESIRGYEIYQEGTDAYNNQRRYLKLRSDIRIFSPFIDWANISNMLDTTNFFGYREIYGTATPDVTYMPYHSSNFPIDGNPMLYTAWMEGTDNNIKDGQITPKPLVDQTDVAIVASAFPIANEPTDPYTDDYTSINKNTSIAYMETMNRFGSTSADHDNTPYGSWYYPRIGMNKHYEWILNSLLRCIDIYLYGSSNQYPYMGISMSPMANSPCSDYNDVYLQMFNGNPNFVNRKLSKSTMEAKSWVVFENAAFRSKVYNAEYRNYNKMGPCLSILNVYNKRSGQPRDKYFTWDYETESRSIDPLQFDILYKKPKGHSRGLWIHQLGEYDSYDVLQYAMKGGKYGINDGACLHLGYLPSDKEVVDLLNADMLNPDALPRGDRFEEGHAISGYGFNGMLLVDPDTNDLICYLDTENARDFDLGCWVAPLSEKIKVENRSYGLLTEIVAENSPRIEQDVNDDTKVTIVENVVYVDNKPENIEPTTVTIRENVVYVDNKPIDTSKT